VGCSRAEQSRVEVRWGEGRGGEVVECHVDSNPTWRHAHLAGWLAATADVAALCR
jgi:hypothetical protein